MLIPICITAIAVGILAFASWALISRMMVWKRQQDVKLAAEIARIKSAPAGALGYIFRKP